uniref:DUF4136 domain-containing protein n=1 Tax=Sphingomonas sp. A1 TaxID=90322 RepID=A0A0F7R0N2_9SPHN|nr:hypothetical protein [Sphingomonas sp. A1]
MSGPPIAFTLYPLAVSLECPVSVLRLIARPVLLAVLFLSACAPVSMRNVWRDPAYNGPALHHVVVMSISRSDVQRRVFEDSFAGYLQQQGVQAQVSYNMLPENGPIANDKIQAAFAQSGADGVLVTRIIHVEQRLDVAPYPYMGPGWYRPGFYGWYGGPAWSAVPADVYQYSVLTLETTLWSLSSGKIVWTAASQIVEPDDVSRLASSLAQTLVTRMRADAVL